MDNRTIIDTMSSRMDLSRETIEEMVEGLTKVFIDCGIKLDHITIPNFGTFETKKKQERVAVHPATGKKLLVPPKVTINFKAAPNLKQRINNGQ